MKTLLGEERAKREAAEKTLAEKAKADTQAKVKSAVEKAISEGRIPAKNEEQVKKWTARLESNFEDASELLAAIPAKATGGGRTDAGQQGGSGSPGVGAQPATSVIAQLKQNAVEAFKNSN